MSRHSYVPYILTGTEGSHAPVMLAEKLRVLKKKYERSSTANVLLIHENTVRYRMEKIKELILYGTSEMDLYLTLSLTAKIYKLKEI